MLSLRFQNFSEYPEFTGGSMSKIRLIVNGFNEKYHDILVSGKILSLDDLMILWWRRLVFKQYIKNKSCAEFNRQENVGPWNTEERQKRLFKTSHG